MNLTRVNGTYSKELFENMNEIRKISFDSSASTRDMKEFVLQVIEPAWIDATAKKRFKSYLHDCSSKKEIYWLCANTINKAKGYRAQSQA